MPRVVPYDFYLVQSKETGNVKFVGQPATGVMLYEGNSLSVRLADLCGLPISNSDRSKGKSGWIVIEYFGKDLNMIQPRNLLDHASLKTTIDAINVVMEARQRIKR